MSNMLSLHPETAAFLIGYGAPSDSWPRRARRALEVAFAGRSDGFGGAMVFLWERLRQEAQQEGTPKRHKPSRLWCVAFPSTLALLPNMAGHVQKKRSGSSTQSRRRLVDTSASPDILSA